MGGNREESGMNSHVEKKKVVSVLTRHFKTKKYGRGLCLCRLSTSPVDGYLSKSELDFSVFRLNLRASSVLLTGGEFLGQLKSQSFW